MSLVYKIVGYSKDKDVFLSCPMANHTQFYRNIPGGVEKHILKYIMKKRTSAVKNTPGIFVLKTLKDAEAYFARNDYVDEGVILECEFRGPFIRSNTPNCFISDASSLWAWMERESGKRLTRKMLIGKLNEIQMYRNDDIRSGTVASVIPRRIMRLGRELKSDNSFIEKYMEYFSNSLKDSLPWLRR